MELIQHQTSCNRHIPSSVSFIYRHRIASELMANSGMWPKCVSTKGCEPTDKWKHMTWWNCRNSNLAKDLRHDNQLVSNGCVRSLLGGVGGHQFDCRAERSAEAAPGLRLGAAVMSSEASSVPNIKLHFAINEIRSDFSQTAEARNCFEYSYTTKSLVCFLFWQQAPFLRLVLTKKRNKSGNYLLSIKAQNDKKDVLFSSFS